MKKILFFVLTIIILFPLGADAFFLSPAKIELTIERGDTQLVSITIKNNDSQKHDFMPVVMGVTQGMNGAPVFVSGASDVESWATTNITKISLLPGEKKEVQFVVNIPESVYPGSYYLGLGAEQLAEKDSNVNLSGRLLSLVNIKVAGTANEVLSIEKFLSERSVWVSRELSFLLKIKNVGNVEIPISANLVLRDFFGKVIDKREIFLGNKLIPNTGREFILKEILPIKYSFIPGIYQADIVINYGLTRQQIVATTKFWYFNLLIVGAVVLLFILLVVILNGKKLFFHRR